MKTKEDLIKQAQQAYDAGNPLMSDEAFDKLTNDESQFKLTDDTYTVKHLRPMGTMNKVHTTEEVNEQVLPGSCVQPKFDGISCEIQLEHGKMKTISTRGNGEYGKDLTNLVKAGFISTANWNPEFSVVYGEITKHSETPSQKDRNIVAGICNSDDITFDDIKDLRLNVYEAYTTNSYMIPFDILEHMFICYDAKIVPAKTYIFDKFTFDNFDEAYQKLFDRYYPNTKRDGIVFKYSGYFELGSGYPQVALKPEALSAITTLTNVSWKRGKSKFSATAIIDPVELGDVTISKVSLPTKYISEMDLHIGDIIEVTRANDVIPRILRRVEYRNGEEIKAPNTCEYGHELQLFGKKLACSHKNCKSLSDSMAHKFVDIVFKGIKRAPKSKFNKLIDKGKIGLNNIIDYDSYKDLLTEREYNMFKDGLTNLEEHKKEKIIMLFDMDGLSLNSLVKSKGKLKDIYKETITNILMISDEIEEFVKKLGFSHEDIH